MSNQRIREGCAVNLPEKNDASDEKEGGTLGEKVGKWAVTLSEGS